MVWRPLWYSCYGIAALWSSCHDMYGGVMVFILRCCELIVVMLMVFMLRCVDFMVFILRCDALLTSVLQYGGHMAFLYGMVAFRSSCHGMYGDHIVFMLWHDELMVFMLWYCGVIVLMLQRGTLWYSCHSMVVLRSSGLLCRGLIVSSYGILALYSSQKEQLWHSVRRYLPYLCKGRPHALISSLARQKQNWFCGALFAHPTPVK